MVCDGEYISGLGDFRLFIAYNNFIDAGVIRGKD